MFAISFKRAQQGLLDQQRNSEKENRRLVNTRTQSMYVLKGYWALWQNRSVKDGRLQTEAGPAQQSRKTPSKKRQGGASKSARAGPAASEWQCGAVWGRGLPWNEAPKSWWPIPSPMCRMRAAPSYALRGEFSSCHCVRATSPSAVLLLRSPNQRLLYWTKSFFPFFSSPSCCVRLAKSSVGRHHTFFTILPLSSSDPNVRVRKHIRFSDPQRRVPSSRFVASRQTNRLRQEMGIAIHKTFFFFALETIHHKHLYRNVLFAAAGDNSSATRIRMHNVRTYKWAGW